MPNAETTTAKVMDRLFSPRSVAVVGVPRGRKMGRMFLEALLRPGFKGAVYPVNPNADEIMGLKAYPSVTAIQQPVDLAIVVTPSHAAAAVIADCGRAAVPAAVLFTAGFDELGTAEGDARADELRSVARRSGVRLVGPNCMGLYVPAAGISSRAGMSTEVGDVSLISQSGSIMGMVTGEGRARGFALNKGVSVGNQLDLQAADFLRYFADDDGTCIIAMYVEGARDGRRLFEALRYAAARKPVVLWKAGRTEGGARAVRSHTAALAGSRAIWEALTRQTGAITANNALELVDLVVALRMRPAPAGARMVVVTGPGGPSISATDALEEAGLRLADLPAHTMDRLRGELADVGTSPRNPVDIGLNLYGPMEVYPRVTKIVGSESGIDGIVVIGGASDGERAREFAELMIDAHDGGGKPLALIQSVADEELRRRYVDAGVGLFPTAERAVRAFAAAARHAEFRSQRAATDRQSAAAS